MKTLPILVAFAIAVGACATTSASGVASLEETTPSTAEVTEAVDTEAVLLAFAQCMRDNGVPDFEDPTVDENGNPQIFGGGGPPEGGDVDARRQAFEACGEYLEQLQLGFERPDQSERQDQLLAIAECMRDAGFDVDDPDFSGEGPGGGPGSGGFFGDIDIQDPDVQAALDGCFEEAGFTPGGPGGGPGGPRGPGGAPTP